MNMIEKVARAIAGIKEQDGCGSWVFYGKRYKQQKMEQAKAALEAMREPTLEMKQKGNRLINSSAKAHKVFQAMITQALNETD